ncbi:MAG: hypothetical protein A2X08_10515 [Bacteroidetes bacterium GWA2_32_17]|nr:MAG: hypothetical protein A2X08_10515 [Bacteroidetes bacterium GWA2_32_17]
MSVYKEKKEKNILTISNLNNPIKLKVDCQYGTISEVTFNHNELKTVGCGENKIVGSASELKGKTINFNGASGNPSGGQIKIIHTIYEEGGNELIYIFPDNYSGNPYFDENDQEPSYKFYINFI